MGTIKTKRTVTETMGITFDEALPYDDWAEAGLRIRRLKDWANFAFGDWLNNGEDVYGELYAHAADKTGYRLESLQTFQRVSKAIPMGIRRPELSYGHHVLVAAHRYPLEEKVQWLELAIAKGWNVREMRTAMAALPVRVTKKVKAAR